jgi:hypothetical protein
MVRVKRSGNQGKIGLTQLFAGAVLVAAVVGLVGSWTALSKERLAMIDRPKDWACSAAEVRIKKPVLSFLWWRKPCVQRSAV